MKLIASYSRQCSLLTINNNKNNSRLKIHLQDHVYQLFTFQFDGQELGKVKKMKAKVISGTTSSFCSSNPHLAHPFKLEVDVNTTESDAAQEVERLSSINIKYSTTLKEAFALRRDIKSSHSCSTCKITVSVSDIKRESNLTSV